MRKSKKILLTCLLVACMASGFSVEIKVKSPGKNQVILVGNSYSSSSIDDAFFARYFSSGKKPAPHYMWGWLPSVNFSIRQRSQVGIFGDSFYFLVDIPKDGKIQLNGFDLVLFGNEKAWIYLPVYAEFSVPEGAKYLYLGSFEYTFADEYFTIKEVTRSDNFDEAVIQTKKKFGEKAELVRAVLREISKEKK